jgi:hypothetical protein
MHVLLCARACVGACLRARACLCPSVSTLSSVCVGVFPRGLCVRVCDRVFSVCVLVRVCGRKCVFRACVCASVFRRVCARKCSCVCTRA